MKTFKDIKVFFSEEEFQEIGSSFDDVLSLIPDDDFDPLDFGYSEQEIEDGEAPESEFEHDMRRCFEGFTKTENGYQTDGTNFLLLCELLGNMLYDYQTVLFDVGSYEIGDGDKAEDLACICNAISLVLSNKSFMQCKLLAADIQEEMRKAAEKQKAAKKRV